MLSKFGHWLARGGAAVFTYAGFSYFFQSAYGAGAIANERNALLCWGIAAIFYVGGQVELAIRETANKTHSRPY